MSDGERATGALVTGGARGLGRAIATRLAQRGDSVFIADVDYAEAVRCAAQLTSDGWTASAIDLDVRDADRIRTVFTEAEWTAPLETVVNNAGVGWTKPLAEVTTTDFDSLMAVNIRGAFFILQAAATLMAPRGRGSIVNVASTSAFTASTIPMVPYDLSKGAIRMLTVAAARELAPDGIRVNAVAPGTVETDLTRSLSPEADALDELAVAHVPMGRLGSPSEIAAAVDFLSSDAASYITGHVLVVDGGWLT